MNSEWKDNLRRDMLPFSDPRRDGSERLHWHSGPGEHTVQIGWISNQLERNATFTANPAGTHVETVIWADKTTTYREFLAGEWAGNLALLASRTLTRFPAADYIPTRASVTGSQDDTVPLPNDEAGTLLNTLVRDTGSRPVDEQECINVLFVTGDAGTGKTWLMKHLSRQCAGDFESGRTDHLLLYVDAQGKALSTFDQALATELDDLYVRHLAYSMIAPLVRNGLIVPIVDGFDELLGSSYEDSFASLRHFLSQLSGRGCVIACARNTYYEQEFATRVGRISDKGIDWAITRIQIEDWGEDERMRMVELQVQKSFGREGPERELPTGRDLGLQDLWVSKILHQFEKDGVRELSGKPFFVAKVVQLMIERIDDSIDEAHEIDLPAEATLVHLINGFAEREVKEKLLSRTKESLISRDVFDSLLQNLAEEMWLTETRSLRSDTVREVTGLVVQGAGIREQIQEYLNKRGPMLGFLTSGFDGRVEFEHEIFFSYFLSAAFTSRVLSPSLGSLSWILSRTPLPPRCGDFFAIRLATSARIEFAGTCRMVCDSVDMFSLRATQLRENAGALLFGVINRKFDTQEIIHNLVIEKVIFAGSVFHAGSLESCSLNNIEFRSCDIRKVRFVSCLGTDVLFENIIVDESTLLDITGVERRSIHGLRNTPKDDPIYAPDKVDEILRIIGFPIAQLHIQKMPVAPDMYDLICQVGRKFRRSNLLWPEEDSRNRSIRKNAQWDHLRESLLRFNIVERKMTAHQGTQREALRLKVDLDDLLRGVDPGADVSIDVRNFWHAIATS